MPPISQITNALKVAELKALALACGIPSSGTKASLAQRIDASIHAYAKEPGTTPISKQRILSIDMGIRNLAFSVLIPSSNLSQVIGQGVRVPLTGIALHSWQRVELAGPATGPGSESGVDLWSPGNMAEMTYSLVRDHFLISDTKPTHILIERQRFRSGGGAAVQEWTLRVNTLEAMIYSTLRTMRALGHWKGEVIPIAPRRVGPFWIEDTMSEAITDTEKLSQLKKNAKAQHKKEKIDLVGNWLLEGKISPVGQAQDMAKSYLGRWQGKSKAKAHKEETSPSGEYLKKLDDLADCLLQGMAWVKWQDNKRLLVQHGPGALLET